MEKFAQESQKLAKETLMECNETLKKSKELVEKSVERTNVITFKWFASFALLASLQPELRVFSLLLPELK